MQRNSRWRRGNNNLGTILENIASRDLRNFNTTGRGGPGSRSHSRPRHTNRPNNSTQNNRDDNRRRYNNNNRDNNEQENRYDKKKRSLSFKYIESLLEQSSEDIAMKLMSDLNGLDQLTREQISNDFLILLIKMLVKVCESPFNDTKYQILQIAFNENFTTRLSTFIATLPNQNERERKFNSYFWRDTDEFWNNLLYICDDLLKTIPTVGCKIASGILKSLTLYIPLFENVFNLHVADDIKNKIKFLSESVEMLKKETEEKAATLGDDDDIDNTEPPNDFRSISIYPSVSELKGECDFLRSNIVKGAYKDINHYLDIQFRLLREDFVAPLRKGIKNYLFNQTTADKKRLENIRIYRPIRFLFHETVRQNYSLRIRFDFAKRKNKRSVVNYANSKRFMFGSLLCFTNDNFKTIIFGRVEERKVEDLMNGELLVGFDQPINVLFDHDYIMVESNVYFEPYYHVLSVLQRLTIEHFPMEKYLIYCQSDVTPPQYLSPERVHTIELTVASLKQRKVFNESQLNAFIAALTQEFVLIQGPPGTGKTYVGLKIAKALLRQRSSWYKRSPMLVICYTNHALDQFLEGLLIDTENIIRVGGQSKNENLNKYNLRQRKKFNRRNEAIIDKSMEIRKILGEIKSWRERLHGLNRYDSIITFNVFEDIVGGFKNSWFSKANNQQILDWLLGGRADQNQEDENPDIVHKMADVRINDDGAEEEQEDDDDDDNNNNDEDDNPTALMDDDIFNDFDIDEMYIQRDLTSLNELKTGIIALERNLMQLQQSEDAAFLEQMIRIETIENQLRQLANDYNYLQKRLEQGRLQQLNHPLPRVDLDNPYNIRPYIRWALYFDWLEQYKRKIIEKLSLLDRQFRQIYKTYEELRDIEDVRFMQEAHVIGMTTTCAARLRSSLKALKCPIVIVEEAAEVLEAHIVTALTENCKHLILIGDHQQLKPSAADYRIETNYKLGVSLFERMVLNKIQCFTLNIQHRMRPEISSLVSTTIYPFLKDHESVQYRPPIHGTDHVLYFLDHQINEQECDDHSKKNLHEAEFLLAYANHLILNGYQTENITIIAAYLGQMYEMHRIRRRYDLLKDLRIAVLDNYQGEECDIILLSLVRSNKENKIGFLNIDNRVCVALSRARNGMFIMGNMDQLTNKSDLWSKINGILKKQNAIGPELLLRCEVHPEVVTYVKTVNDFVKIPEGGCNQKCNVQLACQHYCTKLCHVIDRRHVEYKCREICDKQLCDKDVTHKCTDMCYQECRRCYYKVLKQLPCGHEVYLQCSDDIEKHQCVVIVPTILPCGHEAEKPCHRDAKTYRCPHPCETKVEPCGHSCLLKCHINKDPDHLKYSCRKKCARFMKNCTQEVDSHICRKFCYEVCDECEIVVLKKRSKCPHAERVLCSIDVDDIDCLKPCANMLECGHKCKNRCNEPCGNCKQIVDKTIPICGHIVKTECSKEANRKNCKQKCPLLLPCGHPCTRKCNEPCTQQCKVNVDDLFVGKCGHTIKQSYCYLKTTNDCNSDKALKLCTEPCMVELKCGHKCTGNCGECLQSRFHKRCQEICGVPLICNHECRFPCRAACRPCELPCSFNCVHSKCSKLCGQPCTPCKEPCSRSCAHQKCKKRCGDICDIEPCNQPCDLQLECGHDCAGLCGEPCPPCRICDTDGNYEIFFGDEDDEDARFVILNDCKHVIENAGMEQWLAQEADRVGFKTCPKCKSWIKTTQRYSDYVKRAHQDIVTVQKRSVGSFKDNDREREKLLNKVKKLKDDKNVYYRYYTSLVKLIDDLHQRLKPNNHGKRQLFHKFILNGITRKYQIIEQLLEICNSKVPYVQFIDQQLGVIAMALRRDSDFVSDQEIDDIQHEIARLVRIVEYTKLEQSTNFANIKQYNANFNNLVQQLENSLLKPIKYTDMIDKEIQELLKQINTAVSGGLAISDVERRQILTAINLTKGHWFKCPNGHIYAIGECGGPMQISKCNECGAAIGGQNHQLRGDNQVAAEMDGAQYAAWSEQANLQNYEGIQ